MMTKKDRFRSFAVLRLRCFPIFLGLLLATCLCSSLFAEGQVIVQGSRGPYSPASGYQTVQISGLMNDWNLQGKYGVLKNTHQFIWEGVEYVSSGTHEFRFAANRSWNVFWGSFPNDTSTAFTGKAALKGGNLRVIIPFSGRYYFTFNETTGDYAFVTALTNMVPVAHAGLDILCYPGNVVQFDGGDSYDPDGSIASYVWTNGMVGPRPTWIFPTEGIYDITLTVLDNSGASAQDTVRVTVQHENSICDDFRRETIYSVLLTRFNDGDPTNNFYCRDRIRKDDPHWRGDFKGLMARLDYIRDLGFSTICISPPVENRGALDYTGSQAYDWMKIDPRLESPGATYFDFLAAAHALGLKVMQTVVVNHSSNYGIRSKVWVDRMPHKLYRSSALAMQYPWPYNINLGNYTREFREDNDNPLAPAWFQDQLHRDPWGGGPVADPKTGTILPKLDYDINRFFGTDEKTLSTDWYHRNGWLPSPVGNASPATIFGKHLDQDSLDLATENWTVKNYLNQAVRQYLAWGVDAIRLDFAGNVDRYQLFPMIDDWKSVSPKLFVCADVEGRGSGLGLLGSDKLPSELSPWWYSRVGVDPRNPDSGGPSSMAVFDYALMAGFSTSIADGHFGGLGALLGMDWIYGDPLTLVTFFHSRNQGPGKDRRYTFNGDLWKSANAYSLLWTARGIPCLSAGEETAFMASFPRNILSSGDMLDGTARAYFGNFLTDSMIGATQNHALYKHIKRLNMIRSRVPALQKGAMEQGNEWVSGISFVRNLNTYHDGESYAVVGLSAFIDQNITVAHVKNGSYTDCITGGTQSIASNSITFSVKANSAGIWVLNGPGKIGDDGPYLR